MNIIDFRFLKVSDCAESKWTAWSRVYEYEYVLNKIKELGGNNTSKIHNTSWGFTGCHVLFKEELDRLYINSLHSDIHKSELISTMYYDITQPIHDKYKNYFDFVINISTVEEVGYDNVKIIKNLLEQVRPGGYLIITFDYNDSNSFNEGCGSINLTKVSEFINKTIQNDEPEKNINGNNSICPQSIHSHLQCGVLVIQKS
jgi:SAM-dependent methyltransferase